MKRSVKEALAFVENLELPPAAAPYTERTHAAGIDVFGITKNQAMVVGSGVVSFVAGTAPELKDGIVKCRLLAQLAANKKAPSPSDIRAWYEPFSTL